jgi:hypothetical protein
MVLTRNVPDVICAVRDNCLHGSQKDFDPVGLPGVYVPGSFKDWSKYQQECFLVANLGPWLLSFYVGWKRQTTVPALFLTYEEHFRDQVASFRRMLEWIGWGTEYPTNALKRIADMKPHNFNVGIIGRGKDLCLMAKEMLMWQASLWGDEWSARIKRDLFSYPTSSSRPSSAPAPPT